MQSKQCIKNPLKKTSHETLNDTQLFSAIINNSPDAIQITDHEGNLIYMNQTARKITEVMDGKMKNNFLFTDQKFTRKVILPSLEKYGTWSGEINFRDRKGCDLSVWTSAFLVHDSQHYPSAIVCIVRDLSEHKVVETALQQCQQKYINLFHQASDPVFVCDLNGRLLDANEKMYELFGYHWDPTLSFSVLNLIEESDVDKFRTLMNRAIIDRHANQEITFRKRDDTLYVSKLSLSYIKTGDEELFQGMILNKNKHGDQSDVSNKPYSRLEELISERTLELLELNENLQVEIKVRKEAEKKLLKYQKKLQSLSSQITIIEENEKRRIASELHDCIGQTLALIKIKLGSLNKLSSSAEAREIMRDILALVEQSIMETRTLTFELSPPILYELGLQQALQWLVDQFREKHGIVIKFVKSEEVIKLDNNIRFIIFQAVRELLINIIKHSRAQQVILNISKHDSGLKVTVEDDGIGFNSSATSNVGYGLFNIRERLNNIKGLFDIKSAPGAGARITIITPLELPKEIHN